jgi:polysaccharide export outer membrane protein
LRVPVLLALSMMAALATSGCGSFISQSGPSRAALVESAQFRVADAGQDKKLQYALVPLNGATLKLLEADEAPAIFPSGTTERRAGGGRIGVGDMISITVFESDSGGLFLPREGGTRTGNFITVPTQQVGTDGTIDMPYAGPLRVVGSTPRAISSLIQDRLANRALEPQVVVSVVDRRAGPVSVLGEVMASTRFSLDPGGARLLEAIARAGGPKFPAYESMVTLQRAGVAYKALLSEIARTPAQNVQLQPNDVVYVAHEPRYFLAMGAIGQSASFGPLDRRFTFNDDHITLVDALGRAGGLLDERSNATGIFIYRMEPRAKVVALGAGAPADLPEMVPTVFLVDLRDPAGYFYTMKFAVRHEDVLFVSNAPASDLSKFLSIIVPTTAGSVAIRGTVNP